MTSGQVVDVVLESAALNSTTRGTHSQIFQLIWQSALAENRFHSKDLFAIMPDVHSSVSSRSSELCTEIGVVSGIVADERSAAAFS